MLSHSPHRPIWRRLLALAGIAVLASGCRGTDIGTRGSTTPTRGGVLRLVGPFDVDHLSTTSAYYFPSGMLERAFTRQLVTYPADSTVEGEMQIVPDLATVVPSRTNGGISADGRTYTFHLRRGVKWNASPPRDVVAPDEVRAMKLLCNPASPVGAPSYYRTIVGMDAYCAAFAKVSATAPAIGAFVMTHEIAGITAPNDTTVVFTLLAPTSDFLNLVALAFASPVPAEYLAYVPDGPEFRAHTISDGPYRITHYVPNREIEFGRNPDWTAVLDPVRKAYVDSIDITEGVDAQSVQQQVEAGTADMEWDVGLTTADRARLIASKDPNLFLGPPGAYFAEGYFLSINFLSPNEGHALGTLAVRQALEYAIDRASVVQTLGGPEIAHPLHQAVTSAAAGFQAGSDPYPAPSDHGDPAKAKQLLASAGHPNGLTIKLMYTNGGVDPVIAQTLQASFARAGITVQLVPETVGTHPLDDPDNARRGVWDLAIANWDPDWFGNNGRSFTQVLFDGRTFGRNSQDWGDYESAATNALIDRALHALDSADVDQAWIAAARQVMEDAAVIPLTEEKMAHYHAARVRGCVYTSTTSGFQCDLTMVWLQGASRHP